MLGLALILAVQVVVGLEDARMLTTGDEAVRHGALSRIAAIPADQRSEVVWRALRDELDRLVTCLDVNRPSPAVSQALRCDISRTVEDEYLPTLIALVAQSRDPSVIPTLVRVAPGGAIATNALARFGELAVPALIESAMSSRSGPWIDEASGAIFALERMLEQPAGDLDHPLSDAAKRRITETAREALFSKPLVVHYIPIVGLALATGDRAMRAYVERLAEDSAELRRRGVTDPARIARIQESIRFQLNRSKR